MCDGSQQTMRNRSASGGVKWAVRRSVVFCGSFGQTRRIRCAFAKITTGADAFEATRDGRGAWVWSINENNFGEKKKKRKISALLAESQLLFFPTVLVCLHKRCVTSGAGWWWWWWTEFEFPSVIAFLLPAAASYVCHNCIAQATLLVRVLVPWKSPDAETAVNVTVESCLAHQRRIIICKTRP